MSQVHLARGLGATFPGTVKTYPIFCFPLHWRGGGGVLVEMNKHQLGLQLEGYRLRYKDTDYTDVPMRNSVLVWSQLTGAEVERSQYRGGCSLCQRETLHRCNNRGVRRVSTRASKEGGALAELQSWPVVNKVNTQLQWGGG